MIHSHPSPWPWAVATVMLGAQLVLTFLLTVGLMKLGGWAATWWRQRRMPR